MTDRQPAESSRHTLSWPALTAGALLAGILAMGIGRAAGSFARDSETALLTHIIVALAVAGGAGLTLGTSDLLRDRLRIIRRK